jgi:hypothetical protein
MPEQGFTDEERQEIAVFIGVDEFHVAVVEWLLLAKLSDSLLLASVGFNPLDFDGQREGE